MTDEKHFLIAKVINNKDEQVFWEANEVNLQDKTTIEVTKILNDNLDDLVKEIPKDCTLELKVVKDPEEEADV